MYKIGKVSRELNKVETYLMTASPATMSFKDIEDGTSICVDAWCIYDKIDENTGEETKLMSVMDRDKHVYTCQSKTFMRDFTEIAGIMDEDEYSIVKMSGQTKAGREFIYCVLDTAKLQ